MNGITLAPGHPGDNEALLALWNAVLPAFPLSQRLLSQTLADPYFEPEGHLVARHDASNTIVGWVLCKSMAGAGPEVGRFQNRGGVGALCVAPDFQGRGLGKYLLARADQHLWVNGSILSTLYFPHHLLPGIPAECAAARGLFESFGCTNWHETYDLQRDLAGYEVPPEVRATMQRESGVEIRPAREGEADAVIAFVEREFSGPWAYSTRGHFAAGLPARDFVVAVEGDEVTGFCHVADDTAARLIPSTHWFPALSGTRNKRWGGLGPIGVAREVRGRGLGLALCALAVEELQARGVESMGIDWTSLRDFYGKLGFATWRTYLQGERPIG
jgi:GNAT superfamily N-acetyltransferase